METLTVRPSLIDPDKWGCPNGGILRKLNHFDQHISEDEDHIAMLRQRDPGEVQTILNTLLQIILHYLVAMSPYLSSDASSKLHGLLLNFTVSTFIEFFLIQPRAIWLSWRISPVHSCNSFSSYSCAPMLLGLIHQTPPPTCIYHFIVSPHKSYLYLFLSRVPCLVNAPEC